QIARLLPAENVARRHTPRRAVEFLVAGKEVEEHGGMRQVPFFAFAEGKDCAEQLLGLAPIEEVLLIRRSLIGVAGRDRDADTELFSEIEKCRDILGRMAVEDRTIDVDGEAFGLGSLDGGNRPLETAFHA